MKIINVNDKIIQYVFDPDGNENLDCRITVLRDNDRALLIDTAYEEQSIKVLEDLNSKGIEVNEIILSHCHPDHANGTGVFEGAIVTCSDEYKNNYTMSCSGTKYKYKEPDVLVSSSITKEFGDYNIKLIKSKGHSKCGLIIIVDNDVACPGDLVMASRQDKTVTPYICSDGTITEHIESLKRLKLLNPNMLILAHGNKIEGKENIKVEITKRIKYLERILDNNGNVKFEECVESPNEWAFSRWHENNTTMV
ncbi:MBL fold metallo-hydrolase [Clostridiaceae bacterium M8S5]|nr:MBL fold metallo-hydrolase [Clostridiaceae bacterium M8S5]